MKIGIVIWQLDVKGGTQRQALELAQHLRNTHHQVVVYTYLHDPEGCYPELCEGLDIRYVFKSEKAGHSDYPRYAIDYLWKYFLFFLGIKHRRLFDILDDDIDILNPHDYGSYVTAGLWKNKVNRKVVLMMNDLPLYRWNILNFPKTIGYYVRPRYRRYIQSFERIVVLDELNQKEAKKNFNVDSIVVRSGIDLDKFQFCHRTQKRQYRILIMSVLFPHRRIEDALKALAYLIDWGYDVKMEHVGALDRDIRYTKSIFELKERLRLTDQIRFHGAVTSEKLLQLFRDLDFYLFPNSPQTWGLSVFESMASGLPVICTSGCGASEVLLDTKEALIVEPYSPRQMALSIARLINDKKLRTRLLENGRKFVEDNLSWEKYSREMLKQIEEVFES